MIVATTRAELREARQKIEGTAGVVLTMGALHDGHLSLIRAARERADAVLVTIFVNPLQFGPHEDFDRYPRTLDRDLAICAKAGVDLVFAPAVAEMYPDGQPEVRVIPGQVGEILEGVSRPGFFHGVLTVVLKLLHLTRADLTFFGEKDYQQLTLVRRLARDTDLPVEVVGVPTVREPDGMALSSRNRYLTEQERRSAAALSAALRAGAAVGSGGAGAVLSAARDVLDRAPGAIELDYLALSDPDLGPTPDEGPARLLIAAKVGNTRLIDNVPLRLGP
jgi:pantoate--beta-alanine ligase